ncbi:type 1 glutamine amidotransferase domain-containing protein [Derxia gummosa]|uniref:Type 1 glutamine amidotransferase domain-containing protein n=1 Tax=Derxia gummosa DSM 723 TaxID=1121388 RepID=A0A8B6X8J9_9BURK|nr:type 1 glutamine amidotransferase domain-containing protein [Derxia gummosa]
MQASDFNDAQVAVLVADGFEQSELTGPCEALEEEGARVVLISAGLGIVHGMRHDEVLDEFEIDKTFFGVSAEEFDAVLVPGGHRSAATLREIPEAITFIRHAFELDLPVGAICHGPWLLASAGLVAGRTLTSAPPIADDIRAAGGNWVDREVVVDGKLVSSRGPDDIPAFSRELIVALRTRQTRDKAKVGTPTVT